MKKTRKKSVESENLLLLTLANDGIQSEPDLETKTKKKIDYVRKLIKQLRKKNYVEKYTEPKQRKKERHRGRPNSYFGLSEKGILSLITAKKLEPKVFWRLLYHYFKPNNSFKVTTEEIIRYYEINNLGFDRNETFTQLLRNDFNLETIKGIIDKHYKNSAYQILFQLGITLMPKNEIQFENSLTNKEKILKTLTEMYLIIEEKGMYRLTFFGFMLLLIRHNEIIEEILRNKETEDKSFELILAPHMITYHDFLPLIFGKWSLIRKFWDATELFRYLIWAINDTNTTDNESIITGLGLQEFFDDHRNFLSYNEGAWEDEFRIAKNVRNEFLKKTRYKNRSKFENVVYEQFNYALDDMFYEDSSSKKFDKENNLVSNELNFIRKLVGEQDQKWSRTKSYEKFKVEMYENVFPKIITFRFFTILFQRTIGPFSTKDSEKWKSIFKTDKELVHWYSTWLKKFLAFNEKALEKRHEFLKSLNNFSTH